MKKLLMICILIVSILFVSGCASLSKPENIIIGKWQEIDGTETIEFFKDGTISIVDKTISVSGDYKFVDDNKLRLDLGRYGTEVVEVSISRNELIIEQNGKVANYRRMGATNTGELSKKNIKIQNKLETPEGHIIKIEMVDNIRGDIKVEGLIENPTNSQLKYFQFDVGILYKYVDENDLDKKSVWAKQSGLQTGTETIESRHSLPLHFYPIPDSTSEIKPYMRLHDKVYPPCFTDDPRQECYEVKYVPGEGYIDVPKY